MLIASLNSLREQEKQLRQAGLPIGSVIWTTGTNITTDPESAETTLRRLQTPLKNGFDKVINEDMKKIYGSHNKYQKALDKVIYSSSIQRANTNVS